MTEPSPIDRYAERGKPRGPDAVLMAAQEEIQSPSGGDYLDSAIPENSSYARRRLIAAAAVLVVLLGTGYAFFVDRGPAPTATAGDPQQDTTSTSVGEAVALPPPGDTTVEAAPGWMAYVIDAGDNSYGFVRTEDFMRNDTPLEVYATPEGDELVGYGVAYVGFVDRKTYEAPGFDLERYARSVLGDAAVDEYIEDFGRPE